MDGRFSEYEKEFIKLQASIVKEELSRETTRQKKVKLKASLGRCISVSLTMSICSAGVGGLLGSLGVFSSIILPGIIFALFAAAFSIAALRYRISKSIRIETIRAKNYDYIDNIPRLMHVSYHGKAYEISSGKFVPLLEQ